MALREILILPDKRLRLVSEPVKKIDAEVEEAGRGHVRDHVRRARHRARGDPGRRAQAHRHHGPVEEGRATRRSGSSSIRRSCGRRTRRNVHEEGCLSIPEFYEDVERPAQVRVKYLDLDGKEQELEAERAARHLPAARDRPHQRRAVHRPYLQAQARPHHQEIHQGRQARSGGLIAPPPHLHGHARFRGADAGGDRRARP